MSQRDVCGQCLGQILRVWIDGKPVACDWPRCDTGDVAVEHTMAGSFLARHCPVGEPLRVAEARFRRHVCGDQPRDLSEPLRRSLAAASQRRQTRSAAAASQRRHRARTPAAAVTGVRWSR